MSTDGRVGRPLWLREPRQVRTMKEIGAMFGWLQFISSCLRHVPTCIAGVVRPLAVLKRNRKLWRSGISGPMPEPYNRCVLPGEKLSKVQLFTVWPAVQLGRRSA
jgi:hypothetical protein